MADMADLIVEDGSGVIGAESYVTVAEADAYHARMGNAGWPQPLASPEGAGGADGKADDPNRARKEAALRKAAVFLDSYVLHKANGEKTNPAQGLLFPRTGAVDYSGSPINGNRVPAFYAKAQCEAALLALSGVRLTVEEAAGPFLKRKKTDVLEKEWFEGGYGKKPVFGWLDSLLSGLFGPAANGGARTISIARG